MPTARHFTNRHAWHDFLLLLVISHSLEAGQLYSMLPGGQEKWQTLVGNKKHIILYYVWPILVDVDYLTAISLMGHDIVEKYCILYFVARLVLTKVAPSLNAMARSQLQAFSAATLH